MDGKKALALVEVYDPATGVWSTISPMTQVRAGPAAMLMGNEKRSGRAQLGMGRRPYILQCGGDLQRSHGSTVTLT